MAEIEGRARDIYSSAQSKTRIFTEGEFNYRPNFSYNPVGKVNVQAVYLNDEGITPQIEMRIKYTPVEGKEIEYRLNPNDFSKVAINQKPAEGLFGKIIRPRTQADERDLRFIKGLLDDSQPTPDFANNLSRLEQMAEAQQRQIKEEKRDAEKAEMLRKREAHEEDKAKRKAIEILEKITSETQCLGIAVDDYPPKFYGDNDDNSFQKGLLKEHQAANIDTNISFHLLTDSGPAIRVISHIQQLLKDSERDLPVIIFMDGSMPDCEYKTGLRTAEALRERLGKAGLNMPYLVGNSNNDTSNRMLKAANPDCYITSFDYKEVGWPAIEAVIKGN